MKLKHFPALIALIVCGGHVAAQPSFTPPAPTPFSMPQIAPATPEASTLIRSIQFPVDYTRGSVDVTIPLYEIKVGEVTIPITLSYNHKGVKPLEFTQYVGQGWTLNAEPTVSRKTNGKPDINGKFFKYQYDTPAEYYMSYLADPDNLDYDAFPDEYYYRLSGKSGMFVYKAPAATTSSSQFTPPTTPENSKIATIPYELIKVGFNANATTGGFTIVDDNGVTYEFKAIETTQAFSHINWGGGGTPYYFPTSWKCTKITNPGGNITFAYDDKISQVTSVSEYMIIEDEESTTSHRAPDGFPIIQQFDRTAWPYNIFTYYYVQAIMHQYGPGYAPYYTYDVTKGVYPEESFNGNDVVRNHNVNNKRIKTITFPEGTVNFTMSGSTLSSITVKNTLGTTIRTITLGNEYSSDGYPFLSSLTIVGGGTDEKYNFDYYRLTNGTSALPTAVRNAEQYRSKMINLWGYLGNVGYHYEPIPVQSGSINTDNFWVDVNVPVPNTPQIKPQYLSLSGGARMYNASGYGVLKSIETNSGAVTQFEYESDSFMNTGWGQDQGALVSGRIYSGGLRIKSIKQWDHINANPTERHFKYGSDESGLGKARMNVDQKLFMSTKAIQMLDANGYELNQRWRQRIINSSMNGDVTFSGVPIIYDYVTEYTKANGQEYGKTMYKYDWYYGASYNNVLQGYILLDNKLTQWQMGHLTNKDTYEYDGGYKKVHSEAYSYDVSHTDYDDMVKALQVYISETRVRPNGYSMALKAKEDEEANKTNGVTGAGGTSVVARRDSVTFVRRQDSIGLHKASVENASLFSAAALVDDNEYAITSHVIYPGASRLRYKTETFYTDKGNIVKTTSYDYTFDYAGRKHLYPTSISTTGSDGVVYRHNLKYPQDVGRTDATAMISRNMLSPVVEQVEQAGGTTTRTTYNYYDTYGKTTLLTTALLLPQRISVKEGSAAAEDRLRYLNYDVYGNPMHVVKDNATNVVYLWGQNGRVLVAMIENATYSDVQSALGSATNMTSGNVTDANVTTLRNNTTLKAKALITSYKYQPLVGITEITDPRGARTTYGYDSKHRLNTVRDDSGNNVTGYSYNLAN